MIQNIRAAWKLPEVRKKLLYTVLLIVIFRLGSFIPVPGVNPNVVSQVAGQFDILSFMNLMTGGNFSNFTVFALGIYPYINASIIMQLLTIAIPALERLQKDGGEEGRKKIERITRVLGIVFAMIMSIGILLPMGEGTVLPSNILPRWLSYATIGITVTAGTAFLMWISDQMTSKGIGNGTSFIIFVGIISNLPQAIMSLFALSPWIIILVVVLVLLLITGVVFVDLGERRIPVQYSKRVVGRKMYGGQSSHIPIKVNANGVMPLIFASTILSLPGMFAQFWPNSSYAAFYTRWLAAGTWTYMIANLLLIIGFAYFYSAISFNPVELSKNIQANGGYIPGIRPGKPTSDYLGRISNRLTLFSAFFLAIIASVPTLFAFLGAGAQFGATSVLIMVSVALETDKAIEANVAMRHYKGFLR